MDNNIIYVHALVFGSLFGYQSEETGLAAKGPNDARLH